VLVGGCTSPGLEAFLVMFDEIDLRVPWNISWTSPSTVNAVAFAPSSGLVFAAGYCRGATFEGLTTPGNGDAFLTAVNQFGVKLYTVLWGGSGDDAFDDLKLIPGPEGLWRLNAIGTSSSTSIDGVPSLSRNGQDVAFVTYCSEGSS